MIYIYIYILRSFDLSSATDRFPLSFQSLVINQLCNMEVAFAWVISGLGVNAFRAPGPCKGTPRLVRFSTGQPLGYLSSWPLFALSHHFIVWYCADRVYPGRKFSKYALLGDDIVIGDEKVAEVYKDIINRLGVKKYLHLNIWSLILVVLNLRRNSEFMIATCLRLVSKWYGRLDMRLHGCQFSKHGGFNLCELR